MKKTISFLLCLVLLLGPLFCADALAECSVADITTDDPDGETVTVTVNDPDPVIWVRASGKDRKIEEIILDPEKSIAEKGRALVREANRNGGKDNIAIVLIEPFASEVEVC